jgi:cytidylate kinase
VETILSLAAHGRCVIVGRGAPHLLPWATTLRVRLVAPLEYRVEVFGRERGLSHDEAAREVENLSRERVRFIKDHFHKDPTDPANFDLVLDAARFTPDGCAEVIVAALRLLEGRAVATPAAGAVGTR